MMRSIRRSRVHLMGRMNDDSIDVVEHKTSKGIWRSPKRCYSTVTSSRKNALATGSAARLAETARA